MKCPVCKDVTLLMAERKGVEIDYCPECRGIWLDRGELDKLLETEETYTKESTQTKTNEPDKEKNYKEKRKKESFISEIFDMFGGD